METTGTIITQSNPDINEIVRIYAKEKGLSETAAWAAIRGTFVPKSEVLNIIESQIRTAQGQTGQQPSRISELLTQRGDMTLERLRLELETKKLEMAEKAEAREKAMQERNEAREQRKIELDEQKLALEKEIELKKLELEEKKHQSEDRWRQTKEESEEKWRRSKEESEEKWLRSKEEFDQKLLLVQSGKKPDEALEMVKNQEKFYERILDERSHHSEEVGGLKEDAEKKLKEIKSEMDTRFDKFVKEYQSKPASDDFINKMKEYKKMQNEFLDMTFDTLEARGFDRKSLDEMRKVTNIKAKEQESGIGKFWDLGKVLWKNYVEPAADKATKELNAAPSGLENKVSPEIEKRIREETEAKATQLKAENEVLQMQLEEEKKRIQSLQEERRKLESTASQLGIPYDDTITNEQLFYWIEHQEAVLGQQKAATERRTALEQQEERARRAIIPQAQEVAVPEAIDAHQAQKVPEPEQNIEVTPPAKQEDIINIQEELAKPREISAETQEFISSSGLDGGLIVAEKLEVEEEQELGEKSKTQKNTKIKNQGKTSKRVFSVSNGTQVIEVESMNHKGAALGVAKQFGGTEEAPVRVKVVDKSGEEREYETFSTERESSKGKKWMAPRVKAVK